MVGDNRDGPFYDPKGLRNGEVASLELHATLMFRDMRYFPGLSSDIQKIIQNSANLTNIRVGPPKDQIDKVSLEAKSDPVLPVVRLTITAYDRPAAVLRVFGTYLIDSFRLESGTRYVAKTKCRISRVVGPPENVFYPEAER